MALSAPSTATAQSWPPRHGRSAIAPRSVHPPARNVDAGPPQVTPGSKIDLGSLPSDAPLPPPRPADLDPAPPPPPQPVRANPATPAPAPPTPSQAAAPTPPRQPAVEQPAACAARLAELDIEAVPSAPATKPSDPLCAVATPVDVVTIGRNTLPVPVELVGRPELDCATAQVLGRFVHEIAAPLAKGTMGTALKAMVAGGYQCRPFNRLPGGHVSGHATGIALDVMAFAFADGRRFEVGQKTDAATETFLAGLRRAACGYFTTVLGPGSNAAHANHLHIDTMHHGIGSDDHYRICE